MKDINKIIQVLECQSRLYFRKSQVDKHKIIKTTREAYYFDKMANIDNIIKLIILWLKNILKSFKRNMVKLK